MQEYVNRITELDLERAEVAKQAQELADKAKAVEDKRIKLVADIRAQIKSLFELLLGLNKVKVKVKVK